MQNAIFNTQQQTNTEIMETTTQKIARLQRFANILMLAEGSFAQMVKNQKTIKRIDAEVLELKKTVQA